MARRRINDLETATVQRVEPDRHWHSLRQGDRVSLTLPSGLKLAGVVDAVSGDATAVWVDLDGGRGRTLVHASDGVPVVLLSTAAVQRER